MHENLVHEGWNFEGDNANKEEDESFRASSSEKEYLISFKKIFSMCAS